MPVINMGYPYPLDSPDCYPSPCNTMGRGLAEYEARRLYRCGNGRSMGFTDPFASTGAVMTIPDEVLTAMGEQVAAARHDWETCDPGDVGLNGVVIKQWREGYYEGCKDVVQSMVGRLPKDHQDYAGRKITESFKAETEKLKELASLSPQGSETP